MGGLSSHVLRLDEELLGWDILDGPLHGIHMHWLHLNGLLHAKIVAWHDDYGEGLSHLGDSILIQTILIHSILLHSILIELGGLHHWCKLDHLRLGGHGRHLDVLGLLW
jgi:hypothetical protein